MKNNLLMFCLLAVAGLAQAQDTTKIIRVAVLLYPGAELIDFAGPTDVFVKANAMTRGMYKVYSVAFGSQLVQTQDGGPFIQPTYTVEAMPRPDILVIPGAGMEVIDSLKKDARLINFLKRYQDSVSVTMSVCTGAYLLGSAGLLNNRKATTHYFVADDLHEQYPTIAVVKNVRFVDQGRIVTTSGVSSGIDGALHLVKRYSGDVTAEFVARGLQYTPHEIDKWPVPFKGMKYNRTHPMNAKAKAARAMVDPVCQMSGNKNSFTVYKGKTYYFCSEGCKNKFIKKPLDFVE